MKPVYYYNEAGTRMMLDSVPDNAHVLFQSQERTIQELRSQAAIQREKFAELNVKFDIADKRAEKADKKAQVQFWIGIFGSVIMTFVGYFLGKYF